MLAEATWTPAQISRVLDRVLLSVEKPARYVGGEHNSIVKDWDAAAVRVALVFPDVYELGMSNLGLATLYDILNRRPDVLAERAYCPWIYMEAVLRREGMPLFSLESRHPLADFDVIGISLPYEQLYSNVINLLDLGGVPIRAADRAARHPLVIAGGHATYNPDPMADFIDVFAIGEGEEIIVEFAETIRNWKVDCPHSGRGSWRLEQGFDPAAFDRKFMRRDHQKCTATGSSARACRLMASRWQAARQTPQP